jgi:hypothetical protein
MSRCGDCALCCFAFPVVEIDKPAWTECSSVADGKCSIYEKRPESCRKCECAYIQMPWAVPADLRPDKCGVIFERAGDIMLGTIVGPVSDVARGQVKAFKKEGFRVVLRGSRQWQRRLTQKT